MGSSPPSRPYIAPHFTDLGYPTFEINRRSKKAPRGCAEGTPLFEGPRRALRRNPDKMPPGDAPRSIPKEVLPRTRVGSEGATPPFLPSPERVQSLAPRPIVGLPISGVREFGLGATVWIPAPPPPPFRATHESDNCIRNGAKPETQLPAESGPEIAAGLSNDGLRAAIASGGFEAGAPFGVRGMS